MSQSFVRLPLAISAATFLALSPAVARDPQVTVVAPAANAHILRVAYRDLDLRDGSAQAILKARVDDASLQVCRATDYDQLLDMVERSNCVTNARIGARPQISAAVARAQRGQGIALNAAIRVAAAL